MFIFRLEDRDGFGPWTSDKFNVREVEGHPDYYSSDDYPGLYPELRKAHKKFTNDFPILDFFCGARSLKEFLHWFPENTLRQFKKTEAKISVYKIHKNAVKFGQKQVMFKKDKAVLVDKFCPSKYLEILTYESCK